MKTCKKCGKSKDESAFGSNGAGGKRGACKECQARYWKEWRSIPENRAKVNFAFREYAKQNPAKVKDAVSRSSRKTKYGLEDSEFRSLLISQDNQCAICETPFSTTSLGSRPAVDHNHVTGKVRGLLCGNCNTALGKLKDSVSNCIRAANYLRRSTT